MLLARRELLCNSVDITNIDTTSLRITFRVRITSSLRNNFERTHLRTIATEESSILFMLFLICKTDETRLPPYEYAIQHV